METVLNSVQSLARLLSGISVCFPVALALLLGSVAASGTWRRSIIYVLFGSAALILAAQWTVPVSGLLPQYLELESAKQPIVYVLILILTFLTLLVLYQFVWRPIGQSSNRFWFLQFLLSGIMGWIFGVMLMMCIQFIASGEMTTQPDVYAQTGRQIALLTEEFVPWQVPTFFCDIALTLCDLEPPAESIADD